MPSSPGLGLKTNGTRSCLGFTGAHGSSARALSPRAAQWSRASVNEICGSFCWSGRSFLADDGPSLSF